MKRTHRLSISAKIVNHRRSKQSKAMLRQRFEAETDIEVGTLQSGWKHYAEWIEKLSVRKINKTGQRKRDAQKQDAGSHEHP